MASNSKSHKVQIMVAVIGFIGVLGAAVIANFDKLCPQRLDNEQQSGHVQNQRIRTMHDEITYRLQEIRGFLYQGQMTNRNLYNGTKRIEAHGVGLSPEFKDTELRTLLFELTQATPDRNRVHVQNISDLFDELAALAPQAPFVDNDLADPQKVDYARIKFERIEREWQRIE